jgi:long-chain acyl-CoA synthetase
MVQVSLGRLFLDRAEKLGPKVAVLFKEGRGAYQPISWTDYGKMVREMAFGLASLGVKPGSAVGILATTSHFWIAADLATICNGALSVPLYPNCSIQDIEHILNNSDSSIVFVSGEALLNKLLQVKNSLALLKHIIYVTPLSGGKSAEFIRADKGLDENFLIGISELKELGKSLAQSQPTLVDERAAKVDVQSIATIIYTSGTTGTPKGVPITHFNVTSLLDTLPPILPLYDTDTYLSYLPLSHVFERVCGEFYWLHSGGTIAFAESIEMLAKNLGEVEPTYLLAVPRVLDRIYAKVKLGIDGASDRAKQSIDWALRVGAENLALTAEGKAIRPALKIKLWLAEKLVYRKLRDRIGKNLRFIICGGAPGTSAVLEFFNSIGIPTLEGYGLTETTAPTNCNRYFKIKLGTVGPTMDTVEMKLAHDGEILARGDSIFKGYFKDEKATREAFADGWFKTGDIGFLDGDGYLKITDRKKDIIVNSAGKNIAPQRIENMMRNIDHVSQAIVFGDKRKHLVALFTMDELGVMELARERGWPSESLAIVLASKELNQYLKKEINLRSGHLAEYELIRNFSVLPHELGIDSGELTCTLKVKRNVVAQKYKPLIDSLYKDEVVGGSSDSESTSARSKR